MKYLLISLTILGCGRMPLPGVTTKETPKAVYPNASIGDCVTSINAPFNTMNAILMNADPGGQGRCYVAALIPNGPESEFEYNITIPCRDLKKLEETNLCKKLRGKYD